MNHRSVVCALLALVLVTVSPALAQTDEVKLDAAQPKITTVPAMPVRKGPRVKTEEVTRLKLGTVVSAIARSNKQDTIDGKTGYWYRINLPNGQTGWLFGGLLMDYDQHQREQILRQIIEARLEPDLTGFESRQEIYDLAATAVAEARDTNILAEFELLKLLALDFSAMRFPDEHSDEPPYREWLKAHETEVIPDESHEEYGVRTELFWNLESKYHTLPIAERIAWEATENVEPKNCESDEVCEFFLSGEKLGKYLTLHPNGAHVVQVLNELTNLVSDEVINTANGESDNKDVQQRGDLRKALASLRLVLEKTSKEGKVQPGFRIALIELFEKLDRIKPS